MENMDKGLKMGTDSSTENTLNAPIFQCPKVWNFNKKRLHWASVVRGHTYLEKCSWLTPTISNEIVNFKLL